MDPGKPTELDIFDVLPPLFAALGIMPALRLSSGQRMRCAGKLFAEDGRFVSLVARGLRRNRARFPDVPHDPDEMEAAMRRADGYLVLHQTLAYLAQRAWDNHLQERSTAVDQAMDVVQQVRAEGQRAFQSPDHRARALALWPAECVLRERTQKKIKKAQGRQRAAAPPVPPAPPEPPAPPPAPPPPGPPRPHRNARAMTEARRIEFRQFVDDLPIGPPAKKDLPGQMIDSRMPASQPPDRPADADRAPAPDRGTPEALIGPADLRSSHGPERLPGGPWWHRGRAGPGQGGRR